mmetsp:Transcript_25658/g.35286  ORF Transcript_25658/g.35286 Transcript_25658/m.35286 type:complete len:363 (-) Transcript_25658:839-1927(-)
MPTTLHPEVDVESIIESHAHSLFDDFPRNISETHFDHHEINHYHLSFYFEMAVEFINSLAGVLVLMAVCLAGVNLIIVGINSMTGSQYGMFNPLHSTDKATILKIRLMLGEQTALALALLVAADVLDTVIKPSHAYEMNDVIKMGFLTVLRTGLAYFLAREIKELETVHTAPKLNDGYDHNDDSYYREGMMIKDGSRKYNSSHLRKNCSMQSMRSNHSGKSNQSRSRWDRYPDDRKDSDVTTNSNHSNGVDDMFEISSRGEGNDSPRTTENNNNLNNIDEETNELSLSNPSSSSSKRRTIHSPSRRSRSVKYTSSENPATDSINEQLRMRSRPTGPPSDKSSSSSSSSYPGPHHSVKSKKDK